MPTVSQPKNLGDLLKYEAPNLYSREQDTVAAAQNLVLGTVVGRETITAKLKGFDPTASDGAETAVGVESALTFSDPDELLATFKAEIARWNDENRDS